MTDDIETLRDVLIERASGTPEAPNAASDPISAIFLRNTIG